jgi:hypothetical protein
MAHKYDYGAEPKCWSTFPPIYFFLVAGMSHFCIFFLAQKGFDSRLIRTNKKYNLNYFSSITRARAVRIRTGTGRNRTKMQQDSQ